LFIFKALYGVNKRRNGWEFRKLLKLDEDVRRIENAGMQMTPCRGAANYN
jgi:hypothetical protein